jgi:hypothetical protein
VLIRNKSPTFQKPLCLHYQRMVWWVTIDCCLYIYIYKSMSLLVPVGNCGWTHFETIFSEFLHLELWVRMTQLVLSKNSQSPAIIQEVPSSATVVTPPASNSSLCCLTQSYTGVIILQSLVLCSLIGTWSSPIQSHLRAAQPYSPHGAI